MATWSKLFTNFAWKNRPDTSTPLGQTLLNRLNNAINGIDDRVIALNAEKASVEDLQTAIKTVTFNEKNGVFTFYKMDGTSTTINTVLEKVAVNFRYNDAIHALELNLPDGTIQVVSLHELISEKEFTNSATILFTVGTDGKVTANIKPNSITDQMLQTNYLSDITMQANTAVSASQSALESQFLAEQHEESAQSYATQANTHKESARGYAESAQTANEEINRKLQLAEFDIDENGNLIFTDTSAYAFTVDDNGYLNWEVA